MARQLIEEAEVIMDFQDTEEEETGTGEVITRKAEVHTRHQIVDAGVAGKKAIVSTTVPNGLRNARNRTRAICAQNQATRWRIALRRKLHSPLHQYQVTLPQYQSFQTPREHHFMQMCATRRCHGETNMCTQES